MSHHGEVWVFSENRDLMVELLGKGSELAQKLQTKLAAVLLGHGVEKEAREFMGYGVHKVYVVDDPMLEN